jgi:hypothetical protein
MSFEIRIFLGYIQNKEMKMHLNQSRKWKEARLLGEITLMETQWQENDYIGLFIPPCMTYAKLKEKEQEIKTQLQIYCPKINLDKHLVYLFSQLFLV